MQMSRLGDIVARRARELGLGTEGFIALVLAVMVGSAVMGWLYEMGFYYLDAGGVWVARGHGLGPWLPIYGFGALGMLLVCWRVRERPLATFCLSGLVATVLEYGTGFVLYTCFDGLRLWDYNTEIWNWGNVDGYICARSILLFAFAGVALMRWLLPLLVKVITRVGERRALVASGLVAGVYALDIIFGYLVKGL